MLCSEHGNQTHLVVAFSHWIGRTGGDASAGADLLMPVPLHRTRPFAQRFNRPAPLLAQAIRGAADRSWLRTGWCGRTTSAARLGCAAFAAKGGHLVLIDDD